MSELALMTTPDELGPCQAYCEQLKQEIRRYRQMRCKTCELWDLSDGMESGKGMCLDTECATPPTHGCLAWEKRYSRVIGVGEA